MVKIPAAMLACVLACIVLTLPALANCSKKLSFGYFDIKANYSAGQIIPPAHIELALFKLAMRMAGCQYSLAEIHWNRTLSNIKHGEIDGSFVISFTAERAKFGRYTSSYREEKVGMVMRRGEGSTFNPKNFGDIIKSKLIIGVHLGIWYGTPYNAAFETNASFRKRVLRTGYSGNATLQTWLLQRRVDVFFSDLDSAHHAIKKAKLEDKMQVHPFVILAAGVHIFLSKKTTTDGDIRIINDGIHQLKKYKYYQAFLDALTTQKMSQETHSNLRAILNR